MAEPQIPLTLADWLDDLCVRFILNLPASELSSVARLCFQIEEAQWFYEDFARPAVQASGAPPLPSLSLRQFMLLICQHCPLLSAYTDAQHTAAYEDFLAYKVRVPVRGAILLDHNMEKLVLVRGWKKGASWSFPRGKINKDEKDLDCAIREVYEETGFDIAASNLIPENEADIKHIDITMREQHMSLFVFRGVPEDYPFETKTRKEISKIQWYWIKDLPGFKKHNKQQQSEAEVSHANKFYMVAPFLGQLKKWIGQQRKKDIFEAQKKASALYGSGAAEQHLGVEDESEDHQTSDYTGVSLVQREEELRRLLSIGSAPELSHQPPPVGDANSGDLLALLHGGAQPSNGYGVPHTPFNQIGPFPQQPNTPQQHHMRQPSLGHQPAMPPPHFQISPQRSHLEQQRNPNLRVPYGPQQHFEQPLQPGAQLPWGMHPSFAQQHVTQQQDPPPRMPTAFPAQNQVPFNDTQRLSSYPPTSLGQQAPNLPPSAFATQGPQGAIASAPAAPSASQLPAPNLNLHTMKLLDAFKAGNNKPATAVSTLSNPASRPANSHQAALLDLFKKPATPTPPAGPLSGISPPESVPVSPTPTDATEKPRRPSKAQERRPTLNEITRTLPPKLKAKATPPPEPMLAKEQPAKVPERRVEERPKSRQLFDPYQSEKPNTSSLNPQATVTQNGESNAPIKIMQRPSSKQGSRSPRPGSEHDKVASAPNAHGKATASKENGHQSQPSFTILTRPGSSKGAVPPGPMSPLRNESPTPGLQPQLLKRTQGVENPRGADVQPSGSGTKDQLLALFGKSTSPAAPATASSPSPLPNPDAGRQAPASTDSKTHLLNLFNGASQKQPQQNPSPAPPPAPKIQPALTPTPAPTAKQQNLLLDLFNKAQPSSSQPAATANSPNTPISPFVLGTPATTRAPGNMASILTNIAPTASSSGSAPGSASTPAEAKEFLMGYLNGVVKNEGFTGKRA